MKYVLHTRDELSAPSVWLRKLTVAGYCRHPPNQFSDSVGPTRKSLSSIKTYFGSHLLLQQTDALCGDGTEVTPGRPATLLPRDPVMSVVGVMHRPL